MSIQDNWLLALILIAALVSINSGFYLVVRYKTRLARWAGLILFSQALELIIYLSQWINPGSPTNSFFFLVQVFCYSLFCVFWLLFVFGLTRHAHWIRMGSLALMIVLPVLYLTQMAARWIANPGAYLPASPITGSLMFSPLENGLPGILFLIYGYLAAAVTFLMLLQFFIRANTELRRLILPFLIGPVLFALIGALELSGANPLSPVSIHQLAISSISLLAFWIVFDLRFKGILSSARETVVDQMQDGVLILDQSGRIVEINSAAQQIICPNSKNVVNKNLGEIWPQGAALVGDPSAGNLYSGETTIRAAGLDYTFDINISQLRDAYHEPIGRSIVLRNITGRERMEKALKERAQELQRSNAFLAALAEVTVNLQTTSDLAQIYAILGGELKKLGLFCFIAQVDPENSDLLMSYLSVLPEIAARIEKIIHVTINGYRLDKEQFAILYDTLDSKEIKFKKYDPSDLNSSLKMIPTEILEAAIRLIGIQPETQALVLPLVVGERKLGLMGVWGENFSQADIPPFRIFANQAAHVMERAILYEAEIRRSTDLARSNALIIALSTVASVLGTTSNSELVMDTLGKELKKVGLNVAVVTFDGAIETAFIKYISFQPDIIRQIEKLAGITLKNFAIPNRNWPGDRIRAEKKTIWYPNATEIIRRLFPMVPQGIGKKIYPIVGFKNEDQLCILPLRIGDQLIGAMPIWGIELKKEDGPILSVFGSQVAGIMQNIEKIESEVQRTDELARSNAMIMALSKVAAQLDTTTNLIQLFDMLGNELRKIRVSCLIGTLDDAQQLFKLEYLSVEIEIINWMKKFGSIWPKEIIIPRHQWPTDKAIIEKAPYWDADPVGSASVMFPFIPKQIVIKTFETAGMRPDDPACYLPMINEEKVIGLMVVWGLELKRDDIHGLNVFANQVATALRNTRLYDQAQKEIVERTQAEARVREALNDKEVLLKEVHHRVKNNLQVISSLLNLQAAQVSDPGTVDVLRESQTRVRSMALIHEKLYQSNDLARVDFAGYLHSLVSSLAQTYLVTPGKVAIQVYSAEIFLSIDTAIPCGLIVNELVSNSLKYAFPPEATGTIEISCKRSRDDGCVLVVCDDGAGLPSGLDVTNSTSLGFQLVTSLVKQIDGELVVGGRRGARGTRFEIRFKEAPEKASPGSGAD